MLHSAHGIKVSAVIFHHGAGPCRSTPTTTLTCRFRSTLVTTLDMGEIHPRSPVLPQNYLYLTVKQVTWPNRARVAVSVRIAVDVFDSLHYRGSHWWYCSLPLSLCSTMKKEARTASSTMTRRRSTFCRISQARITATSVTSRYNLKRAFICGCRSVAVGWCPPCEHALSNEQIYVIYTLGKAWCASFVGIHRSVSRHDRFEHK